MELGALEGAPHLKVTWGVVIALRIIGRYVYCPRALLMPTQRLARRSTSNTLCATTTI